MSIPLRLTTPVVLKLYDECKLHPVHNTFSLGHPDMTACCPVTAYLLSIQKGLQDIHNLLVEYPYYNGFWNGFDRNKTYIPSIDTESQLGYSDGMQARVDLDSLGLLDKQKEVLC